MSSRVADASTKVSPSVGIPLKVEAQDNRKGIDDYQVAQSLIRSILLPVDVKAMDNEGGAFWVHNLYDFLLQVSDELLFFGFIYSWSNYAEFSFSSLFFFIAHTPLRSFC